MEENNLKNYLNDLGRLRWACRRGMLELDVLLENFLNEVYPSLLLAEKEQFVELLSCTDPELFVWLMGRDVPADMRLAGMVKRIRQHAQSRI